MALIFTSPSSEGSFESRPQKRRRLEQEAVDPLEGGVLDAELLPLLTESLQGASAVSQLVLNVSLEAVIRHGASGLDDLLACLQSVEWHNQDTDMFARQARLASTRCLSPSLAYELSVDAPLEGSVSPAPEAEGSHLKRKREASPARPAYSPMPRHASSTTAPSSVPEIRTPIESDGEESDENWLEEVYEDLAKAMRKLPSRSFRCNQLKCKLDDMEAGTSDQLMRRSNNPDWMESLMGAVHAGYVVRQDDPQSTGKAYSLAPRHARPSAPAEPPRTQSLHPICQATSGASGVESGPDARESAFRELVDVLQGVGLPDYTATKMEKLVKERTPTLPQELMRRAAAASWRDFVDAAFAAGYIYRGQGRGTRFSLGASRRAWQPPARVLSLAAPPLPTPAATGSVDDLQLLRIIIEPLHLSWPLTASALRAAIRKATRRLDEQTEQMRDFLSLLQRAADQGILVKHSTSPVTYTLVGKAVAAAQSAAVDQPPKQEADKLPAYELQQLMRLSAFDGNGKTGVSRDVLIADLADRLSGTSDQRQQQAKETINAAVGGNWLREYGSWSSAFEYALRGKALDWRQAHC